MVRSVGQSQTISHHLATVDHAVVARLYGAQIVSERQIRATEQELRTRHQRTTDDELRRTRFWVSVASRVDATVGGAAPTHTPDFGMVWPGEHGDIAVVGEIELARKSIDEYTAALETAWASGQTQWWWPIQKASRERLIQAATDSLTSDGRRTTGSVREVAGRPVWWESDDGRIRIYPSLWAGGWNASDLASFDPHAVYETLRSPLTGRADVEARIDPGSSG